MRRRRRLPWPLRSSFTVTLRRDEQRDASETRERESRVAPSSSAQHGALRSCQGIMGRDCLGPLFGPFLYWPMNHLPTGPFEKINSSTIFMGVIILLLFYHNVDNKLYPIVDNIICIKKLDNHIILFQIGDKELGYE